jgi:DNA mismatch endonuclease (patch repair protein)
MDVHSKAQRSFNMSRIRGKDTKPEMKVRRLAHAMGYRYRLHRKDLPGQPDLVFPKLKAVIFVHGCFFHIHDCPYGRVVPKTNAEFWQKKRSSNVKRDLKNIEALKNSGWQVYVIWECQTRNQIMLKDILTNYLRKT